MGDTENKIPLRSEVAVENTWALEDLYATDDDWKADMERLKSMMQQACGYQGRLSQSSAQLLAFLKLQDDINVVLTDFANYSFRKADEDTRNTTYQGFKSQTNSLIVALSGALSFAEPEILSIPDETLEQFYQEQSELSVYKRYIHDIRRKKAHILSNAEEKIMAAAGEMAQAPDEIYGLLNNADMTFPDITDSNGKQLHVTHGSFIPLLQNSDVKVRKAAFESLYSSYDSLKNTSAALLAAQMKQLQFNANMRHYDSALAAALDKDNEYLLMTDKVLDGNCYMNELVDSSWDVSELRTWLNTSYLSKAFSDEELNLIKKTHIGKPENYFYSTSNGNESEDYLVILSCSNLVYSEYGLRDEDVEKRQAKATDYAIARGVFVDENNGAKWWTSSNGSMNTSYVFVNSNGIISAGGELATNTSIGVRPVMTVSK